MKITHILSKTLCIYDGQVPAFSTGGWGSFLARLKFWDLQQTAGSNEPRTGKYN